MENQRIQKLVKLAYIADTNGDYKIADKIFEKLAATPPLRVPRMRAFEDFMKMVNREAGSLDKLLKRIKDLKHMQEEIKKLSGLAKNKIDLSIDLGRLYDEVVDLPQKKALLEARKKDLATLKSSRIDPDPSAVYNLETKIIDLSEVIQDAERYVPDLQPVFEGLSGRPEIYTVGQIEEELKKFEEELTKVQPALKELRPNDPRRLALETMALQFEKANQEALHQSTRARLPLTRQVNVESTKTKAPGKIVSPFTGTTTVNKSQYTKDSLNITNLFKRVFTLQDFQEAFARFNRHKSLLENKPAETQGIRPSRNSFITAVKGTDVDTASLILRENLKDMIQLYDYKFLEAFVEEVKILTERRAAEIRTNPRIGKKPFDTSNKEDFIEASNAAISRLKQDPTGDIIIGLFESIKTFVIREKDLAEQFIKSQDMTPTSKLIANEISLKNPGFLRNTGLTKTNLETIIEKGDDFSIEHFLDFAPGSVKKLDKPYLVLGKGLIKATLYKSPFLIPAIAFFIPQIKQAVDKAIAERKSKENAQKEFDSVKARQQSVKRME